MSPVIFHLLGKILGSGASSVASASFCSLHEDVFVFFFAWLPHTLLATSAVSLPYELAA